MESNSEEWNNFVCSKLTADCIVDLLEQWWSMVKDRFSHIHQLVINQDNGPENHSRPTQFMHRIVGFAQTLTFKGKQPVVKLVDKVYQTRVKLTQQAIAELEQQIQRLPNLPKWFVEITGKPT